MKIPETERFGKDGEKPFHLTRKVSGTNNRIFWLGGEQPSTDKGYERGTDGCSVADC